MNVYVVSWGMEQDGDRMECDAIVHDERAQAQEEFELTDPASVAGGSALARAAAERGYTPYVLLEEVEMLDEHEKPCDDPANWVYDGERSMLAEK